MQAALDACHSANRQGYEDAKVYLAGLKQSIDDASSIITDCLGDLETYHVTDIVLINNIKSQLELVQTEFKSSFFETQNNLETKHKENSRFNITLFGRTKAGKSTLMEILTHGDGSHIGKGGQRTTRDVRSYEWEGMSVTDVPGIDAYGGEEDDKKAESAAIYADLILFMITAGQPEGTEADWLVKLKRMDKPIVCVCNFKQSIGEKVDDFRLKRLLDNPDKLNERMNIDGLSEQFNKFLHEQLPSEHVEFIVTHLLAKYASQQESYASKKDELEKVSRFALVEDAIINEVYTNGVLHRKKCYLSIIDAPLFQQMNLLFDFSSNAHSQYLVMQDKIAQFEDWCTSFNRGQKSNISNSITREYNKLRNSVPGFVEMHLEDSNVDEAWKEHCQRFTTQANLEKMFANVQVRLEEKIAEMLSELKTEMDFSYTWQYSNTLGNYQFVNWKRVMKWTGALSSAGLAIVAMALSSNPLGWAAAGVGAAFSLLAWLCDSKENKLRERRLMLTQKLNESIDYAEKKSKEKTIGWFNINIIKNENSVANTLKMIGSSLLALSSSERQLALGYSKNHKNISKMMIANIFYALGGDVTELDRIECVARVPGRRVAIVTKGDADLPCSVEDISSKLGNRETIHVIKWQPGQSTEEQLDYLLSYFGIDLEPQFVKLEGDQNTIVYLCNHNFTMEQIDSINLIQQIMNIHIILRK